MSSRLNPEVQLGFPREAPDGAEAGSANLKCISVYAISGPIYPLTEVSLMEALVIRERKTHQLLTI